MSVPQLVPPQVVLIQELNLAVRDSVDFAARRRPGLTAAEIVDRLLLALRREGYRIVEEGDTVHVATYTLLTSGQYGLHLRHPLDCQESASTPGCPLAVPLRTLLHGSPPLGEFECTPDPDNAARVLLNPRYVHTEP